MKGNLALTGGMVDGFDSRIGDHWYNPTEVDTDKLTLDGDLIMPDPSSFQMSGTIFRSRTGSDVNLSGATILGEEKSPEYPREIAEVAPPFDDSASTVVNDSSFDTLVDSTDNAGAKVLDPGAYEIVAVPNGKTLELQSGVYYFEDTLALESATIVLNGSGPVKVFIGETLTVQSSTVNPSAVDADNKNRKPADLQFLFADKKVYPPTGEEYSEMIVSNSTINAVLIGAKLQARLSCTQYFGAVQGHNIEADNTSFHYDLALENLEIDNFSKWKLRGLTALPPGTNL